MRPVGKWLISSTPPISMIRSSFDSRPVVSVSKMISRMHLSTARLSGQLLQNVSYLIPGRFDTISGIDDKIGTSTFVRIGHLPGKDHFEFFFGHSWS
ncbi:hypothetical protein AGR2A_Cc10305 [Agrobacterium genomosp. 2 str. CFBP 5494]|uniref:Uncharacterized protein n=1 Tax=Agrobacterium genomosp. 2 str. CFBP 5494 TaxID=1183436 RepID=A0A9W5AX33_9HYPH|nr:hypothetical protein AGR2A_Cc10305 [Agrobacterium genomosp. 2 str. CFBP 5494]